MKNRRRTKRHDVLDVENSGTNVDEPLIISFLSSNVQNTHRAQLILPDKRCLRCGFNAVADREQPVTGHENT